MHCVNGAGSFDFVISGAMKKKTVNQQFDLDVVPPACNFTFKKLDSVTGVFLSFFRNFSQQFYQKRDSAAGVFL